MIIKKCLVKHRQQVPSINGDIYGVAKDFCVWWIVHELVNLVLYKVTLNTITPPLPESHKCIQSGYENDKSCEVNQELKKNQ